MNISKGNHARIGARHSDRSGEERAAQRRNLLPNAGSLGWTAGYRSRFLDSASLRSE
ncbi:MAG: hypothetical protein LBD87_06055 [Prevotellaceae bacterium]|nr:hypothetical protein [Prevotellaceae bacterium]